MAAATETNTCSDFKEITTAIKNFKLQLQAPQICVLELFIELHVGRCGEGKPLSTPPR